MTNIGIIKQVDLDLKKSLVVIGGANSSGKTTLGVRALQYAIVGPRALKGEGSPVRDGQTEGKILFDLGGIEVVRRFNSEGRSDVVFRRNGKVETSKVQDRLDALVSSMTFNPSFLWDSKLNEADRVKLFLEAVGVDFSDLEARRKELYDERTEIGREVKRLKGWLDQNPLEMDAPDELVDVSALAVKLKEQNDANSAKAYQLERLQTRHDRYQQFKDDLADCRLQIKLLQEKEAAILKQGKEYKAETETLTTQAEQMPEFDTIALAEQMSNADKHNEAYRAGLLRKQYGEEFTAAEKKQGEFTIEIEKQDAEKQARLKAAKLPLPGLAATEEGIYLNGHPISRASGRERLTVALSIAIANVNPDFPLICCDGGEQFDAEWLPEIERMAEEAGVIILLTRVGRDPSCSVTMYDGEVLSEAAFVEKAAPALDSLFDGPALSEMKPEELYIHTNALPLDGEYRMATLEDVMDDELETEETDMDEMIRERMEEEL